MKNEILTASALRSPRALLKIDGEAITGAAWTLEVDETEYAQPDTFNARIALSALPEARNAAFWAKAGKVEAEAFFGFPADPQDFGEADLESMFVGQVDEVDIDWPAMTLSLSGRDHTAKLMEGKSAEKYINQTASDVATKLAGKHGLTPKVTATKEKIGRFYASDHVDIKTEQTDWDFLTWLARQEGMMVYVRGKELVFRERPDEGQDPYVIRHVPAGPNGELPEASQFIRTGRSLTVAKGIKVVVRSWNSKAKKAFERQAGKGGADALEYRYTIPNLTADETKARAEKILAELSRHAMRLDFSGSADNLLRIDDIIRLEGTGTEFDQVYYPQSIRRRLEGRGGYEWSVTAKNRTPEAETQ